MLLPDGLKCVIGSLGYLCPGLNEEIALTELDVYNTKLEELDLEAALNFAVSALSNAAAF